MTTTIALPAEFALACKFATVDREEYTRIRHVKERSQVEMITNTRDAELYIRGTMHLEHFEVMSQSQSETQQSERPRCSMFSNFQAEDFDFTVQSRILLKTVQELQNLVRFATGIPPVYRIRFPSEEARFLSLNGNVTQALYLRDRDCQLTSFYMIPTLNEAVEFPFTFKPSYEPIFLEVNPFVLSSVIQSLGLAPRERVCLKLLNPNNVDELKLQFSSEDETGVRITAETPIAGAGRIPWLLEAERVDAFEEEYNYSSLLAIAKMMACCQVGDIITILGGKGGELIARIPISSGDKVCGHFLCVACALTSASVLEAAEVGLPSVHNNKSTPSHGDLQPVEEIVDVTVNDILELPTKLALEESQ